MTVHDAVPDGASVTEVEFRVRFAETDAMELVHHSNYLIWFEVGRDSYFLQQGMDYSEWEALGVIFPVIEAYARYAHSACFGDTVRVRTWVQELRSRLVTFSYRVEKIGDETLLASGWTRHTCVDGDGQSRRIPPRIRDVLRPSVGLALGGSDSDDPR